MKWYLIYEKTYLAGNNFWKGLGGSKNLGQISTVEKSIDLCVFS